MTEISPYTPPQQDRKNKLPPEPVQKDKEISNKKHQALARLFENKNLKASEIIRTLTPYGFFLEEGGKHNRLRHINDGPRNDKDPSRASFFPLPIHGGNDTLSMGVIKGLRAYVFHRLPPEVQAKVTSYTPLEYFQTG